jgi:hypothetical protein
MEFGIKNIVLSKINYFLLHQISGKFSLASQVEVYQMALLLVASQILMLLKTAVIIAGFLRRHINLNGQMERLNLNGMARGM